MVYQIPTTEPTEIVAGDLITWTRRENSNMTIANGWTLAYALVKTGIQVAITTTDNGDGTYLISEDSSAWSVGTYKWQARLTKASEKYIVDSGTIEVLTDFAAASSGYDDRSHWRIVLDNVEAVIQGRATKDQSSYTISGRQLSRTPVGDLIVLYNKAKSQVVAEENAERIKNGLGTSTKIYTRFTR